VSTAGWRLMRKFIAESGRATAGGTVVATCQLCDAETPVNRLVTTVHLGEMLVCCRSCSNANRRTAT